MKQLLKVLVGISALCTCLVICSSDIYAGTAIYIGKDASADGTTIIGATVEGSTGVSVVPVVIEKGMYKKGDVIEGVDGFKYTLPEDNAKVILEHLMSYAGYGKWNCSASNEYGVTVVTGMPTGPCDEAVEADPFVEGGVCDGALPLILTANSKSAKEAVDLLCSLYDESGADQAIITLVADQDEAWVVENFTGHEYAAIKLPADKIGTFADEPVIRTVDAGDPDTICSKNLLTLPVDNNFAIYDENKNIDLILTYNYENNYSDEDHLRGWIGHNMFAPSENTAYDPKGAYDVFFTPDEKVSLEQAFEYFRSRFEGTDYDLSIPENDSYWGISNQTVANVNVYQIFDDVPAAMSTVIWTTPANPAASPFIAVPVLADTIPACLSTDVEEGLSEKDTLQFDFAKLNVSIYPRRNLYGSSVRQYWECIEADGADKMEGLVRGQWKTVFEQDEAEAVSAANDHLDEVVGLIEDDCHRIRDEFDYYLFTVGVRSPQISDAEIDPFECSFDAVEVANAKGWETSIEGDVFTAVKDGKTIEVIFDGDDKGTVTFVGFDDEELQETAVTVSETVGEPEEEADNKPAEEPAGEPIEEPEEKVTEEPAKEETKEPAKEETKEPAKEEAAADTALEIEEAAAQQLEVDTISELEKYFAQKIANVPRNGWAEGEIAGKLGEVSDGVIDIIGRNFNGDLEELLNLDPAKAEKIASDPELAKVGEDIAEAGADLSALLGNYFDAVAEDVSGDIVNGRLTQDGAVKILGETQAEIEGIARLFIQGVTGAFSEIFNTDLTDEELTEILAELGEGTLQTMDDFGVVDRDALGLSDIDLKDLTDADIEIIITLNEMDDETINGLSELLGVDVRSMLDSYLEAINGQKLVIEKHENKVANAEPTEEIAALKELEATLSEEDIEIPQEVIDILTEAINEAAGEEETTEEAGETADTGSGFDEPEIATSFTMNGVNVSGGNGKVMLPASLLMYFNE